MEKITEKLFGRDGKCDSKHRTNVSSKAIDAAVLEEIKKKGLTLERVDDLVKRGYPFFRYSTQVTLHGVASEAQIGDGYSCGYKALTVNDNKSLGIRWVAVDYHKKMRVGKLLKMYGWSCSVDSQGVYVGKSKPVSSQEDVRKWGEEWKTECDRFDWSSIFGSYSIGIVRTIFGPRIACQLNINGLYEEQIMTLVSALSGKSICDIEIDIADKEAEDRKRREEQDRELEEWRAQRKLTEEKHRVEMSHKDMALREELQRMGFKSGVNPNDVAVGHWIMDYLWSDDIYRAPSERYPRYHYWKRLPKGWKSCDAKGEVLKKNGKYVDMPDRNEFFMHPDHVDKSMVVNDAYDKKKTEVAKSSLVFGKTAKGFYVGGDTYVLRGKIKELGGKWSGKNKRWEFGSDVDMERVKRELK